MPDWDDEIRRRLAGLQLTAEREHDVIEELSAHLDDHYQECRAGGASAEEARRLALLELSEAGLLSRELRPLRQARMPEPIATGAPPGRFVAVLWQDLRYALRTLRHGRGFAAAAVSTLALGIGANTAIFSLVNATLFQSLAVHDPDHLVHVTYENGVFSYPEYVEMRDRGTLFDGLAAFGGITASLSTGGETDLVTGFIVTGNYFPVLGLRPARGRLLAPGDDVTPGAHPVAVLSHGFWQGRFNGSADAVGRAILLNGHRFTIVGVTPEGFTGSQLGAGVRNLYVPMMMQAVVRPPRAGYSGEMNPDLLGTRNSRWLTGLGRLRRGVSPEQAASALTVLAATLGPPRPADAAPRPIVAVPVNVGDRALRSRLMAVAALLMCVVGAVLLLACANVANLMLSRAAARRREIAVRLALGASRRRLVSQLLTESVLLSLIGGLAGLMLAFWIMGAFRAAPPPPGAIPFTIDASIDVRVLAFTLALSVLAGIAFGLAPALSASRPDLVPVLKDESFVPDERRRRYNMRGVLVVSQVALSLVLLVAAGLFLRNLEQVQAIRAGFDVDRLVSAQLPVNLLRYTKPQGRAFYRAVVERVKTIPGVESAAVARVPVLAGSGRVGSIHIEGREGPAEQFRSEGGGFTARGRDIVNSNVIGPGYFRTLGVPMLAGRDFDDRDVPEAPLIAVVNDAFARLHFPDRGREEVLGRRISADGRQGPWREIVAVVADSKYGTLTEPPTPILYLPLSQNHETGVVLYVRTTADPASVVASVRGAVRSVEPNLPLPQLGTVADTVASSLYVSRMGAVLLGAFAGLAVLLAAIGVYSVTSFSIAQRTREIGVRMALGARWDDVVGLVLSQGMRLVAAGIVVGMVLAVAAARSVEGFLYGMSGWDALTFAVVPLVLGLVALAACLLPARRAIKMDPLAALRYR
jgi:predicted permease